MKVKELLVMLQNCDPNAEILVNEKEEISLVWNMPLVGHVSISTVPTEEEMEEIERDAFFTALAEELEQGATEILDAMKINGVR